ncbi:uncharacterized protein [Euphorbia lathyris]|uniref:uncharacterized protein isoform X2 n=1 Tax=Euphorbia lathyris TaxID=212925 RepID=UPI0033130C4C
MIPSGLLSSTIKMLKKLGDSQVDRVALQTLEEDIKKANDLIDKYRNGDEEVADLMKQIKADAWTYADALAFMMSDIPLIRRVEDQFVYSKITQFDQETRRKFLEDEARKKSQAAHPQPDTGKRPIETAVDPPLKKRRPNTVGSTKLMADAIRSAKPTEKMVQMAKPDIGGYWSAKFGAQGSFENESLLNDLDEALGQVGEVQRDYDQIPGSIHVHKGKSELLSLYARLRTLENGLIQNVADRATIEKLEKDIANANSAIATANANLASATAALVLRDEEIQSLKAKIASDAKSHEDALGEAEYTAGEQAFFYGEMLMAYFSLAHPGIDFTDPEFTVPEPEDMAKFKKMPDAKEYLRNYVRRWMKGSLQENKPSTIVAADKPPEMPSKADSEPKGDKEVSPDGGSVTVDKKDPPASIVGEGSTEGDALII